MRDEVSQQILIPKQISKQILSIGPEYKNHRGGVGAVISIYSKYFEEFHFIRSHAPGSKVLKALIFAQSIFELIFKLFFNKQIKIIHLHGSTEASFYRKYVFFLIAKKLFGKKIIYHIHGGRFKVFYSGQTGFVKKRIKKLIQECNEVFCLSESWKDYFVENFNPTKINIIPNIIDFPLKGNSLKKQQQLNLLFLGLICDQKGIFDLLAIIKNKRNKYSGKLKLVIGGNGEIERLENFIEIHQLSDLVEFSGWVSDIKKHQLLQNTDVYILPSYNEGLPISILEAMSYKHPVIATNVGGIPEIVHPHKNGILVEPGQLSEIENAIDFFLENPEKIKSFGEISFQMVMDYFPENVIQKLRKTYNKLLEN